MENQLRGLAASVEENSLVAQGLRIPTFIFGSFVLLYIASFVVFAVIRILTGVSIQRLGYLCLKRISYEPKPGLKIDIRKFGLLLHRPTFVQPTWVSIVIHDSVVRVDLREKKREGKAEKVGGSEYDTELDDELGSGKRGNGADGKRAPTEKHWEKLLKLQTALEKLHKFVKYLKFVDVVITNAAVAIPEAGVIQVGSFQMMADTREQSAKKRGILEQTQILNETQRPVEWMMTLRNVLFNADGKEPMEVLNHCLFNLTGILEEGFGVIKDSAISIKFGRVNIPVDDFSLASAILKKLKADNPEISNDPGLSFAAILEELAVPGSRTERIAEALLQSRDLLRTIIENVKEVQIAIGQLQLTKIVKSLEPSAKEGTISVIMKELGMDIHRLDQKSPAHRMYFSSKDVAHQALLAVISVSVLFDDGAGHRDRLVYVPMITMTSKTTLPSKTIELVEKSENDRNANIVLANIVVTSPSVDLEPRHLPWVLGLLDSDKPKKSRASEDKVQLISRLLPKASVKFSVHEPVVRILLPSTDKGREEESDMLISSHSSISADLESSHLDEGKDHYYLNASLRIVAHELYYQSVSGERHDLLQTETLEIRAQMTASPEVQVLVQAYLDTFALRIVRPEIAKAIQQMALQLRSGRKPRKPQRTAGPEIKPSFLRKLPLWLSQLKFDGKDIVVEIAGVDKNVSENPRGLAFQVETWTAQFSCQKQEILRRPGHRRRAGSKLEPLSPSEFRGVRGKAGNPTDGRSFSMECNGVEGYIWEGPDQWEQEPFFVIPTISTEFTTSSDSDGQLLHVVSRLNSLDINYSLQNHYTCYVAAGVIRDAIGHGISETRHARILSQSLEIKSPILFGGMSFVESPAAPPEFMSFDLRVKHIKVKAKLPSDPALMITVEGLDAGLQRWSPFSCKARSIRAFSTSPKVPSAWVRLISIRHLHVGIRITKRQLGSELVNDHSLEVDTDAIRIGVPHQFTLYCLTDGIVNAIKSVEQMHYRHKTGKTDTIQKIGNQPAKKVPRIALRSKAVLFELEDDPFEARLNLIYRTGLAEQKLRLQRQAAYDAKVQKMVEAARAANLAPGRPMTSLAPNPPRSRLRTRTRTMRSHKEKDKNETLRGRPRGDSEPTERPETSFGQEPPMSAGSSTVSLEEAYGKLQKLNSTMWIRKIRVAKGNLEAKITETRRSFWGSEDIIDAADTSETLLRLPTVPSLLAGYFNEVDILVDKPSFALQELPDFLYRVGKGLPKDTQFALLVPMSIKMDFKEARVLLRDYPLPFIHVPRMGVDQSSRIPSWSLSSDLVVAEELWGKESKRTRRVNILTPTEENPDDTYYIDVIRTVAPVKSYSDFKIKINTSEPTQITWCTSYQPAIQDMMMVFETFSKPHVDTSERVGFWDKIRLVLHSELTLSWKDHDGEVQLNLKGSRDPYKVTGKGAGFVMCWRGNVQWSMGRDHEPQKFMKVEGDEFVLAIPSFNIGTEGLEKLAPATANSATPSYSEDASARFKKVVMKLSGRARFLIGLAFEQDLGGSDDWKETKRSFDFIPHYAVTLRSPEYCVAPPGEVYDAFKGFRSQYIHLSISVICPLNRDWAFPTQGMSASYNTIHLTPRFFTHFFSWWQLFAGNMSLPIRQGALWPGPEKSTKKFARHLATIEYQLLLAPLFISHIYKHNENEDGSFVGATGLKCRLDSFMMDLHQRREEVTTTIKGLNKERHTFGMKLNQAMVDFHAADIRAVSATIAGATAEDMKVAEEQNSYAEGRWMAADMNKFDIHDDDYSWVDLDDFIEVDWELPPGSTPQTIITPLAFTPRFTYFRQTDHSDPDAPLSERPSPFGIDVSHDCIITENNDPREIQCSLVQTRLEKVHYQMKRNKDALDSLAQRLNKDPSNEAFKQESQTLVEQSSMLFNKICFLESMLRKMSEHIDDAYPGGSKESDYNGRHSTDTEPEMLGMDDSSFNDYVSDFDNRFIVHNLQAKWNNSLRNTILRYIHQINQRRGFVYYMSRRAVKFILDIIEERERENKILHMNAKEQEKQSKQSRPNSSRTSNMSASGRSTRENSIDQSGISPASVQDQLKKLLDESNKYTSTNPDSKEDIQWYMNNSTATKACREDVTKDISEDYLPLNSYHVRLIAPQIQLQSDKGKDSAVLVTAEGMQLNIISIMDKKRITDDVSGLVQRRYLVNMDNAQFFVTNASSFAQKSMWLHSANRYGASRKTSWPPWIPLENMFDFRNSPLGFSRIVDRTSAMLRYDKHNSLRLKYSDQVSDAPDQTNETSKDEASDMEKRIDNVWVDFPKLQAKCNSAEYYAMFMIVQDVLLYSEPTEKLRSEKLEKIMLASDFSDLRGAPEMVERLQEKVNQLVELKHHLQTHSRQMDANVWDNVLTLDCELNNSEEELFFLMKAITTVQRKYEDKSSSASGTLRWYLSASDVVWNLLRIDSGTLELAEFQLQDASYQRVDNADGSNYNTLDVRMMRGFNLLPNAVYPEMIAPYYSREPTNEEKESTRLLRVEWHMLEAIAGIPVINHFQVDLFPLKIQLEREIGEKLLEYIFPNNGKENTGLSTLNVQTMKSLPVQGLPLGSEISNGGVDARRDEGGDTSNNNSEQNSLLDDDDEYTQNQPGLDLDPSKAASAPSIDVTPLSAVPQSTRLLPKVHSDTAINSMRFPPRTPNRQLTHKDSNEMLSIRTRRSNDSAAPSMNTILAEGGQKPSRRKIFHRSSDKQQSQSDELTQMISRASSYMSLVYIKIPSVVLFLSYKGRGERNFEDVHEFVFKMPMLEYRNKTWSNLDLAMRLKKDIMKALISHTGAILENKLTHQRPNNKTQPKFLRMMGGNSTNTPSPLNPDSVTISRASSDLYQMPTTMNNNNSNNEDLAINTNIANRNLPFTMQVSGPSPSPRRSSVRSTSSMMSADSSQSGNHVLSDSEDNIDTGNPLRTAFRNMSSRPGTRDGGRPTTRDGARPTTRDGGMAAFFNADNFISGEGRKRTALINFGKKAFGGGAVTATGSGNSGNSSSAASTNAPNTGVEGVASSSSAASK